DHLDAEVDAAVVDRRDVAAGEREQVAHALVLQSLRDKVSAVSGLFHRRPRKSSGKTHLPGRAAGAANRGEHLSGWRSYDLVADDYGRATEPQTGAAVRDL